MSVRPAQAFAPAGARPSLSTARVSGLAVAMAAAMAYLVTRLANLTHLPLFIDEGTYLWWGEQLLGGDLARGFGQGKPLVGWLVAAALATGLEPVVAGRLVSVLMGGLGLAATAWLAGRALGLRVGVSVAVVWVLLPYMLVFERVLTPDQILASLASLALAVSASALEPERRLSWAVLAGALWVAAVLAKLPVSLGFLALPLVLFTLTPAAQRPTRRQLLALYALPAALAAGVVLIGAYRFVGGMSPIGFGFDELLMKSGGGEASAGANVRAVLDWFGRYLGWPAILALGAGGLAAWRSGRPLLRLAAGLVPVWLGVFIPIANFWVPRYVLPVLPAMVVLIAWAVEAGVQTARRRLVPRLPPEAGPWTAPVLYAASALLLIATTAPFTWALLFTPQEAPLAAEDRTAYVEGFGAGYGLPEAAALLNASLDANPASQVLTTDIAAGQRLRVYLAAEHAARVQQVHIVNGQNQTAAQMRERVQAALTHDRLTYLLMTSRLQWTSDWQAAFPQAVLERAFDKPGGLDAVLLFRLPAAGAGAD